MNLFLYAGIPILAYLIGSISTAVWVGKIFFRKDIREFGSKNAGATNTFRVLGAKAGIPVLIIDIMKGILAVNLCTFFQCVGVHPNHQYWFPFLLGFFAALGHVFPLYTGFRGGKGVAVLLGIVLGINPVPALISLGVFIVVFLITRIVSISSLLAGLVFPLTIYFLYRTTNIYILVFAIIVTLVLFFTHRKNIKRLIKGEEPKLFLKKT